MITDKTKCKIINYFDATIGKLDNRSITVEDLHDSDVGIMFKILDTVEPDKPRAAHANLKNKIAVTSFKISEEAALALYECLRVRFETRKYLKKNDNTTKLCFKNKQVLQ